MIGRPGELVLPTDLSETDAFQLVWMISKYVGAQRNAGAAVSPGLQAIQRAVAQRVMPGHPGPEVGQRPRVGEPERMDALLVTYGQAADLLGYSLRTVKRRVAAGDLVPVRDRGCARLRRSDIDAYIDSKRTA